jgi:hypothetical protein
LLVDFTVEEVALQFEVVVDLTVDGGEFFKSLKPPTLSRLLLTKNSSIAR